MSPRDSTGTTRRAAQGDPACKICQRTYGGHSGDLCPFCRAPVEHHGTDRPLAACVAGQARMAKARLAAGLDLDDTDRRALEATP